jgi:Tfp pilus assembly protein FimT
MGRNAGFSFVETAVVLLLTTIVSAVGVVQMKTSLTFIDADAASNVVISQLSYARQTAIDQRRNILVQFLNSNEIKVTRDEQGGGTTVLADVTLPQGYTFSFPSGYPDTPDHFGNNSAVYFNNGTSGTFLGDGTFVDGANVLLNGSVFTMDGGNGTARAVTLTGSTGRVKQYWLQGAAWVVR